MANLVVPIPAPTTDSALVMLVQNDKTPVMAFVSPDVARQVLQLIAKAVLADA